MKKYFVYELKGAIMPTIVATCVACLIYVFAILAYDPIIDFGVYYGEELVAPPVAVPVIIGLIMCFIAPAYSFSYMMNSRSVDSLFSMPIKREKLYLVKSIVCFLQIIVPYVVSYWLGFVMIALKTGAILDLIMFLPLFFAEIPMYALLLGLVTFGFTRANKVLDGIIMMCVYCELFSLIMEFLNLYIDFYDLLGINVFEVSQPLYAIWFISETFGELIIRSKYVLFWANDTLSCLVMLVLGVLGWVGLFLTAKHRKAEDAGRVSDSIFAYRLVIPIITVISFATVFASVLIVTFRGGSLSLGVLELIGLVLDGVSSYLAYCFFRRSFKLKASDYIALVVSICIGLLLGALPAIIALPVRF